MATSAHLAIDLGAESGRAILGVLSGEDDSARLALHELHRFPTASLDSGGVLSWNIAALRHDVLKSLSAAAQWCTGKGLRLSSVGVDTWGVDYGLLGPDGGLLEPPRCYRDSAHHRGFEILRQRLDPGRLYARTGIHPMPINTLSQLAAQAERSPATLQSAQHLLLMPDLFHHLLCGRAANESTIASTSQMLDAATGAWAADLLPPLEIPARLLGPIVPPGTTLGPLLPDLAAVAGLPPDVQVIAPASHDTASAVAAVPAAKSDARGDHRWCYLSSGTWSLMGVETAAPILSRAAHLAGFTNERGIGPDGGSTIRFLKNITGLWLLQGVRADLEAAGRPIDYAHLTDLAAAAAPFRTRIDIDAPELAAPGDMCEKLRAQARGRAEPEPNEPGDLARCCFEALALSYRRTLKQLESLLGKEITVIHLVGGGGRNTLLNQMTADATGRRTVVGPHEATAAGNVLVQALGAGRIADPAHIRRIVGSSFARDEYAPRDAPAWDVAARRYEELAR